MSQPSPARALAARVLERVARDGAFADIALEHELMREELPARDAALATELVYGTLRWQRYLDWILAPHASRPLESLDVRVLVLLRMTAYQSRFLQRVPVFAAVNDAVTLARARDKPGREAFVNAVLRAFARTPVREPTPPHDPVDALAIRWSHPTWLCARWIARYGRDDAIALMRAMNERPSLTIRTNTLAQSRSALATRLQIEEGLDAAPTLYAPEALRLDHAGAPGRWRAFQDGALAIQDEASMLVARLLEPRPGDTIADACAAPGTKTTHLAELMENRGTVLAMDAHPARLERVAEACTRLGVRIVETLDGPVEEVAPRVGARCDGVLVDAPCSNLGVLRRNPDVKWRRREDDLPVQAERQRSVLGAATTMVRPGGRLVYATCSLEPEENDAVMQWFLGQCPEFRVDAPPTFPIPLDADGVLRCLPHRHGIDGFTAIRFRRER